MRFIILLFSSLLLSGCVVSNLQQLQLLDPQANDFDSALAAEYLAYATAEAEQGYGLSAEYFAGKGIKAWRGEYVAPEAINEFLPEAERSWAQFVRNMLIALLTDDVKDVVPQQAARAQLLYDCWLRQKGQESKATSCTEELKPAILELQTVALSFGLAKETKHELMFVPGGTKLGRTALQTVTEIADTMRGKPAYVIELEGRADDDVSKRLLARRADSIRSALTARGISDDHVRIKDNATQKAVYLSGDDTIKDRNKVRITILSFEGSGPPAGT